MLIVKLQGGLGNQMFQYALGRALSLRIKEDIFFDRSWFTNILKHETARTFNLDVFSLALRFANQEDIPLEQHNAFLRRIPFWRTVCGLPPWTILFDRSQGFQKEVLAIHAGQNVFLQGFWQSEQYFKDAQDTIRQDFSFKSIPDAGNQAILKKMADDFNSGIEAVSVHVRRGDYSVDPKTNAHHGLLPLTYYQSAASVIEKRCGRVAYYVFSDDLAWCRDNLSFKSEATFVDVNEGKPGWMDMRLMSQCQHHIIANSSFSWWGAWLNPNSNKIVVAPQEWSIQSSHQENILPDGWLKISKNG